MSCWIRGIAVIAALAAAMSPLPPAHAAGSESSPPAASADYNLGADAVKARDWERAAYHLKIVALAEPGNADAQNLLGYTYRNQRQFELAFRHYGMALQLDPNHRGANEYIGEAYVLTGNRAKAQEHLAALERICGKGCEEYQDLARAIAAPR